MSEWQKLSSINLSEMIWDWTVITENIKTGKLVYRLEFVSVNGTSNPAVFNVKGYASARSLFSFLTGNIEIPF